MPSDQRCHPEAGLLIQARQAGLQGTKSPLIGSNRAAAFSAIVHVPVGMEKQTTAGHSGQYHATLAV